MTGVGIRKIRIIGDFAYLSVYLRAQGESYFILRVTRSQEMPLVGLNISCSATFLSQYMSIKFENKMCVCVCLKH